MGSRERGARRRRRRRRESKLALRVLRRSGDEQEKGEEERSLHSLARSLALSLPRDATAGNVPTAVRSVATAARSASHARSPLSAFSPSPRSCARMTVTSSPPQISLSLRGCLSVIHVAGRRTSIELALPRRADRRRAIHPPFLPPSLGEMGIRVSKASAARCDPIRKC